MNTKLIFAALVSGLLVLPVAGCMEDRGEDYRARYDRETDLFTEEVEEPGVTTGQELSLEEQGVIGEEGMQENELTDQDLVVESDLDREQLAVGTLAAIEARLPRGTKLLLEDWQRSSPSRAAA